VRGLRPLRRPRATGSAPAGPPSGRGKADSSAGPSDRDEPYGVVVRLIDGVPLDSATRAGLLRRLALLLVASARRAGAAAVASGRWLSDMVEEFAPQVPVRDLPTLRRHYDGLSGDALARAMIDTAARSTGAGGAARGVVSWG
jgi:hypothetical protein